MGTTTYSDMELGQMSKQNSKSTNNPTPRAKRSKLRGWLFIAALALATAFFFVAGTLDTKLRYEWFGI